MATSFLTPFPIGHSPSRSCVCTPSVQIRRRLPSRRVHPARIPRRNCETPTTIQAHVSLSASDAADTETDPAEKIWRKHNSTLVNEADRYGVDAAVEMLWSLNRDGNAVTQNFNQVVSLLANNNRFEDGLSLADEAGQLGMANIITYRPLMKWCCSKGSGRNAKRVWKAMARWSIPGDMFLYAELMGALVRSYDMQSAIRVLASIRETGRTPHIILYNTLLKGYARQADVASGFGVLKMLEDIDVVPDETTFNTLLNICVRASDADSLQHAIVLMDKHGIKPGVPTFNTILKLYSRKGPFKRALAILDEMKQTVEPSIVTYNTLIDGCAHRGDMNHASIFFEEMIGKGMMPDICTMTSLLKGFGRSRDPERAVELFEAMKIGGFQLEDRTRYAVVNACLRCGDRENARRYLKEFKEKGLSVRLRTWSWMLECDIMEDDEESCIETLQLMYSNDCMLDMATKRTMLRFTRERKASFVQFERELKAARTSDS